jgi:hypothetical protein
MNLNQIKKYVINLNRRPERLEHIKKEFEYIGWDFERFEAIDLNSYEGCLQSHISIVKKAKQEGLEEIAVFEDDIFFMPYSKSFIPLLNNIFEDIKYGVVNLCMSIHRPLDISKEYNLLLDLTNLPPKDEQKHRGIFGTGIIIYHKSVYDDIINYEIQKAIDEHLDRNIYPKHQSYSTILPFSCQLANYSDVSGGFYNNYYLQTYNFNGYTPHKLPTSYQTFEYVQDLREKNDVDIKTLI